MICSWIAGRAFFGATIECAAPPLLDALALALAALTALAAFGWACWTGRRSARALIRRIGAAILSSVAAFALAAAIVRPEIAAAADPGARAVAIVIDVSESATRDGPAFEAALDRAAALARSAASNVAASSGVVIAFAGGAEAMIETNDAASAARAVAAFDADVVRLEADRSDGAAGLGRALDALEAAAAEGARPAIVLVGDGWWSSDAAAWRAQLRRARRIGAPVFVIAVGADGPAFGLVSADLAPRQVVGRAAVARFAALGDGVLRFGASGRGDLTDRLTRPTVGRTARPGRFEVVFDRRGVQWVEIGFESDGVAQRRRLMTTVAGPATIYAFGETRWLDVLDPAAFDVRRVDPSAPPDLTAADAIVIGELAPSAFAPGFDAALRDAVLGGTGLFLVNGPARAGDGAETTVGLWEPTAIDPLLPVSSDPRTLIEEPPPRDIVIVIDTSGSMARALPTAQEAAALIIDQLRDRDRLGVATFSDAAAIILPYGTPMDADGRRAAQAALDRLAAGGGTSIDAALRLLSRLRGNYCAGFLFTDGDARVTAPPPGCAMTVVQIGGPRNVALERIGYFVRVATRSRVSVDLFDYFKPDERVVRFRDGAFTPLAVSSDPQLTPPLPVDGLAIAFARVDAERISTHPQPPLDPLVAFSRPEAPGRGVAGVFMGRVPQGWIDSPAGEAALNAYVARVVGWDAAERLLFEFEPAPGVIRVRATPLGDAAGIADLSIVLRGDDGRSWSANMRRDPARPGVFVGRFEFSAGAWPGDGVLEIVERGEGAAPAQYAPFYAPPPPMARASGREALDFGLNLDLLRETAAATGGAVISAAAPAGAGDLALVSAQSVVRPPSTPIHLELLALAAVAAAGCVMAGGSRR